MVIMENPIKMDDLGIPPFKETPIYHNHPMYGMKATHSMVQESGAQEVQCISEVLHAGVWCTHPSVIPSSKLT